MIIPQRKDIFISSEDDPLDYYYKPFIGRFFRKRLELALSLMGETYYERLLEVGFGSGIFLPELARHCRQLYGIDVHVNIGRVREMLEQYGTRANLSCQDIRNLDFPDEFFDGIICMSVFEHFSLEELKKAVYELSRVAKEYADIIVGIPVAGVSANVFSKLVGFNWKKHHLSNQNQILTQLGNYLTIEEGIRWPNFIPRRLSFYRCVKCRKPRC